MKDPMIAEVHIKKLRLRAILGFNPEERTHKQDIIIDAWYSYDASKVCESDAPEDCFDYKDLKYRLIDIAEQSECNTIESLAARLLDAMMAESVVMQARITVAKPGALRYADSVSVSLDAKR